MKQGTPLPPPPPPPRRTAGTPAKREPTKFSLPDLTHEKWNSTWQQLSSSVNLSNYVPAPMIAVLGDTSSGKSSLLSSLTGLELPSSSTLTTRCPVLIQLTTVSDATTNATATVHIPWRRQPTPNSLSPRERKRELESSVPISVSKVPFEPETVDDLSQLPGLISKAQQCILEHRGTKVAPDVIHVQVSRPRDDIFNRDGPVDLTIVDLPGLVQFSMSSDDFEDSSSDEKKESARSDDNESEASPSLMEQVQQVMQEYLTNPNCILLTCVSATVDLHNSKVLDMARQVDPSTRRTVVVLTKPDLVDPGSEGNIADLVLGKASTPFLHGFFMVKNRGQAALDAKLRIAEALDQESEFFSNHQPWKDLFMASEEVRESRLGIPAVRRRLEQLQLDQVEAAMPSILEELGQRYDICQKGLDDIGPFLTSRIEQRRYYQNVVQDFVSHVSASLSGKRGRVNSTSGASSTAAAAQLHEACKEFSTAIQAGSLATIQSLVEGAQVLVSTFQEDVRGEIVHIDENQGWACVDFVDKKDHTTDTLFDGIGYTHNNISVDSLNGIETETLQEDEVWSDGKRIYIARNNRTFDSLRRIPLDRIRTDPSWLTEKIAQHRTDDLACFLNVDIFQQIVTDFVREDWAPHCEKLIDTTQSILSSTLQDAVAASPALQRFPLLLRNMEETCDSVSSELIQSAKEELSAHLETEQHHPYTQDHLLLDAMARARHKTLRRDLEFQLRLDQEGVVFDTQAISTILDQVFAKHRKPELYLAEELELVLSTYGEVATKRVLDRSPMICWQVCRTLTKKLQDAMGCATDEELQQSLQDSPDTIEKYEDLSHQLKELEKARDIIKSL